MWKSLTEFLRERMLFADDLAPPFLCSIGAHIANLRQQERFLMDGDGRDPFWFIMGRPEDLRVPVLTVAPPGFSKSYTMKFFIGKEGLLPFPNTFMGKMTEAGLVGSISQGADGPVETRGTAWQYRNGIVAFNEMSNILSAQEQEKNVSLINQFMEIISEGEVSKRLLAGPIHYRTFMTPWGGTQPARLDTSSGIGRRFLFSMRSWSERDPTRLKEMRSDRGKDRRWDPVEVTRLRHRLARIAADFNPESIIIPKETFEWLKTRTKNHIQLSLMERALLGRAVLEDEERTHITLTLSDARKAMLTRMLDDINRVSIGSDYTLLLDVVKDIPGTEWTKEQIYERMSRYGYDWSKFNALLESAVKSGLIHKRYLQMEKIHMYFRS